MQNIKPQFIKGILKNLNMSKYYEHATHIIYKLNNVTPPHITRDQEELFKRMFREIQVPFEMCNTKERSNFLSYSYILHKFCELIELDHLLQCFPLLKSKEKLREHDRIWEQICDYLRWEFIPSI